MSPGSSAYTFMLMALCFIRSTHTPSSHVPHHIDDSLTSCSGCTHQLPRWHITRSGIRHSSMKISPRLQMATPREAICMPIPFRWPSMLDRGHRLQWRQIARIFGFGDICFDFLSTTLSVRHFDFSPTRDGMLGSRPFYKLAASLAVMHLFDMRGPE